MITLFNETTPMGFIRIGLRAMGLFNQENRPWSILAVTYHTTMLITTLVLLLLEAVLSEEPLMYRVQTGLGLFIMLHMFSKHLNILLRQTEVKNLLNRIDQLRSEALKDDLARVHFLESDASARKFTIILFSASMIYVPIGYVFCIFNFYFTSNPNDHLMIPIWVPWPHREFRSYVAAQTFAMVLSCSTTLTVVVLYIFLGNITIGITSLAKSLQSALQHREINGAIYDQHVNIIRLIHDCNKLLSGLLYLELLISTFAPCGFGYMTVTLLRRNDPLFYDALYKFVLALAYPYILCSCGQRITLELGKLHDSAYLGPWVESSPSARKNLVILMSMTLRPPSFNYKKFAVFALPAFTNVIQGTYSYLTIMVNLEPPPQ